MPACLLAFAVPFLTAAATAATAITEIRVDSPDGNVRFALTSGDRLTYTVTYRDKPVIEASSVGIVVDAVNLAEGASVGDAARYTVDETYPWNGGHSTVANKANGARIAVTHARTRTSYTLDVRAYDDGIAFRHVVPGSGRRVPDEATTFRLPATSRVWFHDLEDFYEGVHKRRSIGAVQPGAWAAPPVTFQVTNDGPYGTITEGGLLRYSGMALQGDGQNGFAARLAHDQPITWVYRWDFKDPKDEARVKQAAAIEGPITTPWRVVMIAPDLNALVNSDLVHNVAEPPDPKLFPKGAATEWIKPGRAVWEWSDGGSGTLEGMKDFSRRAGELGYEYNVLEGFWSRWTEAQIKELVDYSAERGVGILLWRHRRELSSHEKVVEFAELCRRTGVKGVKVDAFNHEHKEVIDLEEDVLRTFAERHLLVDLHGTGKNAGQERTYPNQIGHEGIHGMESSPPWAVHDTTLPFTRMLAGLGDFTPVHFGRKRGETTWTHQVANAVILSAPLLVLSAHPANIQANPAVEILKSVPSTYDETIVLPGSQIGEVAAFARRKGDTWFVAVTNGVNARTLPLDLSFLAGPPSDAGTRRGGRRGGSFQALLVRDGPDASSEKVEALTLTTQETLYLPLVAGGGFVGRFSR
jgi:alpha-glucosidase